jgi:hypothetical protein
MKIRFNLLYLFLLMGWLLTAPAGVRAQFVFITNADSTITITGYTGTNSEVIIPETTNGYPVSNIGFNAFNYCTNLVKVTIPNSITNIEAGAFYGCGLTNAIIPSSVNSIGSGSFELCLHLTSITIHAADVGNWAFYNCNSLTVADLGDGVKTIGDVAFSGCSKLLNLNFHGNAPRLGTNVFSGDSAMVNYLPGTTNWGTTFGGLATSLWYPPGPFRYSTNNGAVTVTRYIGTGGAVDVPDAIFVWPVKSIGQYAFFNSSNLTSITIANGVKDLGVASFYGCISLTNVYLSNIMTNIGPSAFGGCTSLEKITIPSSVTSIEQSAFNGCTSLKSITVPDNVIAIGPTAFSSCSNLISITMGIGVTNIPLYTFTYCSSLKGIYFRGNAPSFSPGYSFADIQATIYYLPGTTGWDFFAANAGIPTALWLPQVQTDDGSLDLQTNQFGFDINWASGETVVVEASSDLRNWQPIQTNILTTGSAHFSDLLWRNYPGRFYRIHSP